ncbi:YqaJ viral recombinase family protein [Lysobacter sp. Hz 25]|uniref:YqaJ viral recombinase family nuclease n=1 Tax=Lysobacter sp. Hz 25 TaxID=3383698 RepID=UPI0038D49F3A
MNAVALPVPAQVAPALAGADHDRQRFIGGSDIAAVLGISPWRTPLQLWELKTRPLLPDHDRPSKPKTRGHRWESVVAEMLVEHLEERGHKVEIVASNRRYIDPELPFLAAEIDFEIVLDDEDEITNVELKTVHPFKAGEWGEAGTDESPVFYTAQGMHGLGVTKRRRCLIAPLFGADEIRAYPIERDDETIAAMRARATAFWQLVLTNTTPTPLNLDDLDRLYKGDDKGPALIADNELTRQVLRLRAIQSEIKAREREFEALEFDVKLAMRDATELVVDEKAAVTWKQRATSWLDQTALKEQHPKLVREFTRKGSARVFTVK